MVSAWFQAEKLAIDHVRDRGQGMPVVIIEMSERPSHSRNREALSNIRILVNVFIIVVIDEVVAERLPKHRPRDRC